MKPTLVLLAAGMSTRYGRLKQLEPVGPGGEALLDYAVFDARRNGFNRVLLIIREELEETFQEHIKGRWPEDLEVIFHHQKITDLSGFKGGLDGREAEVSVLEGRTKPWGTGHALLSARAHLRSPFTLLNADDFYGAEAFHLAAEMIRDYSGIQLSDTVNADALHRPSTFGLVTYTLADTLSEHGGVSRGICTVDEGGWLGGIREVLEIDRDRDGLSGRSVSGQTVALAGQEPISTNFWLFTPAVFPLLEEVFMDFLHERLDEKTRELGGRTGSLEERDREHGGKGAQPEFLIPTVVNQALEAGTARVRTIPTAGRFLGITHPEDRPWVVEGLAGMTRDGGYPAPLWG